MGVPQPYGGGIAHGPARGTVTTLADDPVKIAGSTFGAGRFHMNIDLAALDARPDGNGELVFLHGQKIVRLRLAVKGVKYNEILPL